MQVVFWTDVNSFVTESGFSCLSEAARFSTRLLASYIAKEAAQLLTDQAYVARHFQIVLVIQ